MSGPEYKDVYGLWREAKAFLVDGYVCGDFSVPSPEDLADAEAAEEEGNIADWMPCVAFDIYGEHGMKREYFVDREMLENAETYDEGFRVVYCDGRPLEIEPLFSKEGNHAAV